MKKSFVGLFLITAMLSSGCLGNASEQIKGTWVYAPVHHPDIANPMQWDFLDNGQVIFNNFVTLEIDTGTYELYMNGTHRMLKISSTTITDNNTTMNGEWYILTIDNNNLLVGVKRNPGGFLQRDLVKQ